MIHNKKPKIFEELEKIAPLIPCPFYWGDLKGTFLGINNQGLEILKAKRADEVIGKNICDLYSPEVANALQKNIDILASTGEDSHTEDKIIDIHGRIRYLNAIRSPVRDTDGTIIGIVGASIDITERKNAEENLKLEKERAEKAEQEIKNLYAKFENIIDCAQANIYWSDRNHVYLGCNQQVLNMLGLKSRDQIVGKTYKDPEVLAIFNETQADSFKKDDLEVMLTGNPKLNIEEPPIINAQGERIYYLTTRSPWRDAKGEIIGVVGTSIDISDRKEAERLRLEKFEEQEKFMKTVLQVVHDIRSPLMVIDILSGETSHFPEEQRVLLKNATQRINDIASNLMNTYKSQSKDDLAAQPLPLFVFISRLFSEKQLQYAKQNIEFKLEIEEAAYFAFTLFELSALQRILSNLINNAVEAIENTGMITLELRLHQPPRQPRAATPPLEGNLQNKIFLSIKDSGKGIPPEILSKIGKQGLSYDKVGTGLGLSHAIETLKKNHGDLHIESQIGQGTTVTLELPLSEAPSWFAKELEISQDIILIIIDDDSSIHYLWDRKLTDLKLQNTVHHFYFAKEFDTWASENSNLLGQVILLCDNELIGSDCNGRELIEKYQSQVKDTLLVTSYYSFHDLAPDLIRLNTRLLPKELVMQLPIKHIMN